VKRWHGDATRHQAAAQAAEAAAAAAADECVTTGAQLREEQAWREVTHSEKPSVYIGFRLSY
jgi:hypothetical protein